MRQDIQNVLGSPRMRQATENVSVEALELSQYEHFRFLCAFLLYLRNFGVLARFSCHCAILVPWRIFCALTYFSIFFQTVGFLALIWHISYDLSYNKIF